MYAKTLMEKARAKGHSDAEIARQIGLTRSNLCDALAGRRTLSAEAAALLADLVGENAQEAAARQMVENAKEPKRSRLEKALFACWVAGVAALLAHPHDADAHSVKQSAVDSLYIVVGRVLRLIVGALSPQPATIRGCAPDTPWAFCPPFGLPPEHGFSGGSWAYCVTPLGL